MDPLDNMVPQKVRDNIWSRDYLDLVAILLEDEEEMELCICNQADKPSFKMVPNHKKDITSILQWQKAFRRYATVYLRKFPDEHEGILIYMDIISELAEDEEDWINYDKRFRKNHAHGREVFGNVNVPMYIRAAKNFPTEITGKGGSNQRLGTRASIYRFIGQYRLWRGTRQPLAQRYLAERVGGL